MDRYIFMIYFSMMFQTLVLFFFFDQLWLILVCNLNLIPQIVHTMMTRQRNKSLVKFFLMICTIKPLYVFYVKGCPSNIFETSPNYTFCYILGSIIYGQLLIVIGQQYLGSRFFIPKFMQPKQFEYEQKIDFQTACDLDCPICMCNLSEKPDNTNTQQLLGNKKVKIMVTPCQHKFHPDCFISWLNVKQECPTCRAKIPSHENQ